MVFAGARLVEEIAKTASRCRFGGSARRWLGSGQAEGSLASAGGKLFADLAWRSLRAAVTPRADICSTYTGGYDRQPADPAVRGLVVGDPDVAPALREGVHALSHQGTLS